MAALPQRGDVGSLEDRKDPIFLLQSKHLLLIDSRLPEGVGRDENLDWFLVENQKVRRIDRVELCELFPGAFHRYWVTEHAYFTREEADSYCDLHESMYPSGWRVSCCSAKGELATLLRARSLEPTGTMKRLSKAAKEESNEHTEDQQS